MPSSSPSNFASRDKTSSKLLKAILLPKSKLMTKQHRYCWVESLLLYLWRNHYRTVAWGLQYKLLGGCLESQYFLPSCVVHWNPIKFGGYTFHLGEYQGEVQCVPKGSELLYKDSKRIRKFVLYSRKISSNIQKCFLTLENSLKFFSTVSNLWYINSWKEMERIFKG